MKAESFNHQNEIFLWNRHWLVGINIAVSQNLEIKALKNWVPEWKWRSELCSGPECVIVWFVALKLWVDLDTFDDWPESITSFTIQLVFAWNDRFKANVTALKSDFRWNKKISSKENVKIWLSRSILARSTWFGNKRFYYYLLNICFPSKIWFWGIKLIFAFIISNESRVF